MTIIARPWLEKLPTSGRIGIGSRFCPAADFWGTGLPTGHPKHGPDKAFHNQARGVDAIPGSPVNPGLCSSRAIAVLWPGLPATSLSFCATFSPANQSNSWEALSPLATVAGAAGNTVFTCTQYVEK